MRRTGLYCFFLFFVLSSSSGFSSSVNFSKSGAKKDFSSAEKSLKKVLKNYQADSLVIPLRQDIFLSILKTNLTSQGQIFLKGQKFRLDLKGNPSSLSLFDGVFFWHQPDLKEKLVFQIKKASEIQKISSFFSAEALLHRFQIVDAISRQSFKTYHLQAKKEIQGLKKIIIKTDKNFLLEMRFIWEDLNTWQKYTFSKPVVKEIPNSFFEWTEKGYRILKKEDFLKQTSKSF